MCFEGEDDEHVLLIGDWGGVDPGVAANNAGKPDRPYLPEFDYMPQARVAEQFNKRASQTMPRYILNVGDNFYWGGCDGTCGNMTMEESVASFGGGDRGHKEQYQRFDINSAGPYVNAFGCSDQFYSIFETMYLGPGLDDKPWLSCLGNHDYGGRHYWAPWEQQIAYTWSPSGRWVMPGLYYHQHVQYPSKDFSVDYYILDTNLGDAVQPDRVPKHNICSREHNLRMSCAPFGPANADHCVKWFQDLWDQQVLWLRTRLTESRADWKIIVTHFPPETCVPNPGFVLDLKGLGEEFGIDLIVSGHRHSQGLYESGENGFSTTAGIPYIVTGGGGGITSDGLPGNDIQGTWQYGFMDMTINKTDIIIEAINQAGTLTGTMHVKSRSMRRDTPDGHVPAT